jgi:hypothetical protein
VQFPTHPRIAARSARTFAHVEKNIGSEDSIVFKRLAIVCLVVSGGCMHGGRQVPAAAPASTAPARNPDHVSTTPPRPLHKGHVDLSTGVYIREDDDLVVNTPMPIVLRRTYNSGDSRSRQFGLDAMHPGEWWIYGDGDPRIPWGDLILADGGRIHHPNLAG